MITISTRTRGLQPRRRIRPGCAMLLAAALFACLAGLVGGTVQADPILGEVTNLRLWSDAPGGLSITWDAPATAPADYRVVRARDDLSYHPRDASDQTHRGNSYPDGADTSLTGQAPTNAADKMALRVSKVDVAISSSTTAMVTVTVSQPENSPHTVYLRHRRATAPQWGEAASVPSTDTTLAFTLTDLLPNARYDLQTALNSSFTGAVLTQFVMRPADRDIEGLAANGNSNPKGIWSDGTTLWVVEDSRGSSKLFAYSLAEGAPDADKELSLDSTNAAPRGIYANSDTMWVSDLWSNGKVFAYDMSAGIPTGEEAEGREFHIPPRAVPGGLWGDVSRILALDHTYEQILARNISSSGVFGAKLSDSQFEVNTDLESPRGIWSDGTTLWVVYAHGEVHAYSIQAGALGQRRKLRDIRLQSDNSKPWGIWSNGSIAWVSDEGKKKLFAYYLPAAPSGNGFAFIDDVGFENLDLKSVDVRVSVNEPQNTQETVYFQYRSTPSGTWGAAQSQETSGGTATFSLTALSEASGYEARISLGNTFGPGTRHVRFSTLSKTNIGRRIMKREVVLANGHKHPWLHEAYYSMRRYGASVNVRWIPYAGATYLGCQGAWCHLDRIDINPDYMDNRALYAHELGHAYNYATGYSQESKEFMAMGWLYFAGKVGWRYDNGEEYADSLASAIFHWDDVHSQNCSDIASDSTDRKGAIHSIVCYQISPWFDLTYSNANLPYRTSDVPRYSKDYDLEKVWSDLKRIRHSKIPDVRNFEDSFGGYCDFDKALSAAKSSSSTLRNPWRAGGCVARSPSLRGTTNRDGEVTLTWRHPAYDGGSPVTGYRIEWRNANEEFDGSRSEELTGTSTGSRPITGLEEGWVARVAAMNENGQGEVALLDSAADVTLYSLSLDPTTLDPGFSSDVISYLAQVPNSTTRVTVRATPASDGATISLLDANGNEKADADGSVDGHQSDLDVGDNLMKIRVTSLNGAETRVYTVTVSRDELDMSLTPSPGTVPPNTVPTRAEYRVTFTGLWDPEVTPSGIPQDAYFSHLAGAVHAGSVSFLVGGERATRGMEFMAERGNSITLREEIAAAGANKLSVLHSPLRDKISRLGSETLGGVTFTTSYPRITLVTKIGPSPDWFTGVSGLYLIDDQGNWRQSHEVDLFPWDAGTERGTEFSERNAPLFPANPIGSIRGTGKFTTRPIARLTFTLLSVIDEAPPTPMLHGRSTFSVFENDENFTGSYTVINPQGSGPTLTWRLSGTDRGDFVINEQGELRLRYTPDYERPVDSNRDNIYEVTVRAVDDSQSYGPLSVSVIVTDVNEPPTITTTSSSATGLRQPENRTARLYIYSARDPEGSSITWSVGGSDGRFFAIDERGQFSFKEANPPDFEQPGDSGRDNVYNVTVQVRDDEFNTASLPVTVTVREVNEGPEVSGQSAFTVAESQDLPNAVYTGFDPEGGTVTRWNVGGRDGGDFTITQEGLLTFRNLPDYERPVDSNRDNIYELEVRPYDGRYYGSFDVTVTVTDVNEAPEIRRGSRTSFTQNENQTSRLYTYSATDPEGSSITWSVGGSDGRFFAIDERGQFSFKEANPPDFEQPGGSGRDNVYNVTVQVRDDEFNTASLPVTVTVRDVNEGPEISRVGNAPGSVPENQDQMQVLARYTATDPEGGTVSRWRTSGTDGGDFVINEQGELRFRYTPDYERPADSNRDNVYEVTVRASDGRVYGNFDETIVVTSVNEPPEIRRGSRTSFTQNENQTSRLYTYSATDPERSTVTWAVGGTDGRFFAIDERGQFSFMEENPPNYEIPRDSGRDNVYNVTVQVRDDEFNTASLPVTVTVRDVNEGPEVSGPSAFTIAENQDLPNAVYIAADPEGVNVARWSVRGRDGGDFFITQGGTLYFRSSPDYERPADSNRDNVYEVSIQPSDGRNTGSYPVTVTVTDVNEAPEIRRGSTTSFTQSENRTSRLYTYSATDPEGGTITWSVGGTDGRFFTIDERGQFSFKEDSPPDFDTPGDDGRDNIYNITIEARDPESNTASLPVTVMVTEINEGPVIARQGNGPGSVPENHGANQVLATYTASDPERPSVRITRWSTAGTDGGDFVINALGELRFRNTPDYERPADSNRDNVYEVTIRASDGRNTGTLEEVQVVTVTDVNEPPTITTTSRTTFSQPENRTSTLYTFRATEPEGGTVTWTAAGTDGRFFTIDERGQFSFKEDSPPDFDAPGDAGGNNVYNVTVQARDDAFNSATLDVVVTVTDHNENVEPTITTRRPPTTYRENGTSTIYTFRASDPQQGTTITWSLTGTDAGDFTITRDSSGRGVLAFNDPPDFEDPDDLDEDNTYELAVVATDDEGNTDRVDVTITVTDDNEGVEPTISTRRPPSTYRENNTSAVYTFRASDPQRGTTITWSVTGTDAGDFTITLDSSGRGVLVFNDPPDFESPADSDQDNEYELTVVATDDEGNTDRVDFTISVTDIDEGPQIRLEGAATTTVPENTADTQVLARYTATDPENPNAGIFQWSTSGRDGGDFVISELGELRFRSSPDYERPADSNRNNVYEVTIRASDGRTYGMLEDPLSVTVTEVNEAPVITTKSRTEFSLRENSTSTLYTYRATDQDNNDIIRWSVEGTDGEDFAIYNGVLTFRRLPDLENPVDSDEDNVYEITVVAADRAGLRDTVDATITVTDQPEGPVIAGRTSFTVAENYDITQVLGSYTATDAKDGRTVHPQWSLSGRDSGDFVIDRYSSALSFRNTPDYDRPADSNRDNVYEVTVRGHDSRAYGNLNVKVAVTNINEEAPVVTGRNSHTVRENTTSDIYTYRATDSDLNDTITWSVEGTDGDDFTIDENGALAFASAPDYESPTDSDSDNLYEITVVTTDGGGLRGRFEVTVTVTELNERPVVSGTATFTVNENQDLPSATYTATDPEATDGVTTTITWSVSGRDGGDFTIERETGALTFRTPPDYERPADSNRDNEYEVTVRAYDGRNYGTFDVTVTVLAVNEGPEITGRDAFSYRENGTSALYTYRATDPEGDEFTWDLGGLDAGDFEISEGGVLTFASPPNFDSPAGSGTDGNEYLVTVQARDDQGNTGELPVTVTVTDRNEGATVSGRTEIAVQENRDPSLVLATYTASDPEGQAITRWSLGGSDSGDFSISGDGELTFRNTPDYDRPADSNRDNEYRVTVRAYDGSAYGNLDVTITVSNQNEHDPVIRSGSSTSFSYREENTSALYTYSATDQDKDDVITWTMAGTDGHLFELDERNALTFREPPDYEDPRDTGRDNEYELAVVATDSGGLSDRLDVTVTVTAVDEGPEITGATTYTVAESQELTGATFTARDPEDPTIDVTNWRTSGTDGGDFTMNQDGELSFRRTPDYERPADSNRDNVYLVTVQASDGRNYGSLDVTVTVTDQNESNPVVSGRDTLSVRENTTSTLYTYSARDMDRNAEIMWSVRGADSDDFTISDTGELSFSNNPNHEQPADSNSDNVYEITVVASDGSNEGVLDVDVTVTEVNEGPEISGTTSITVSENHEAVLATYTGRDPEDAIAEITRWSVTGRDGGDFTINEDGKLTFRNPPDYERPADSDRDNEYEVTVRASDGQVYGTYEVAVNVEAVDEAPEFQRSSRESFSYRENGASDLYTYRATDPEGAEVTWSVSGTDGEDFEISETGVLSFEEAPDYDDPADDDDDNEYEVTVVATDQTGHGASLPVKVTVTDVNEGPIISGTGQFIVRENHDAVLGTYTGRDPEDPDLAITRWSVTGRDRGDFAINEDGELAFRNPPDYERPADSNRDNTYEVTVRASDGSYYGNFEVTVTVEAVNEPPDITGDEAISYQESSDKALETYRATDPEKTDITWGLSGADSGAFAISETGVLTFLNAPDYESPTDSGSDNVYEVTVEATDEDGETGRMEVTVTVTNVTD